MAKYLNSSGITTLTTGLIDKFNNIYAKISHDHSSVDIISLSGYTDTNVEGTIITDDDDLNTALKKLYNLASSGLISLPIATINNIGGIKTGKSYSTNAIFSSSAISSETPNINSVSNVSNRYYAIETDKSGLAFVNIPWVNTEYSFTPNNPTLQWAKAVSIGNIGGKKFNVTLPQPTKTDVGLGNVDNTSDLNKPISTATQNALDKKLDDPNGTSSQFIKGDGSLDSTEYASKSELDNKIDRINSIPSDTKIKKYRDIRGARITDHTGYVLIQTSIDNPAPIMHFDIDINFTGSRTFSVKLYVDCYNYSASSITNRSNSQIGGHDIIPVHVGFKDNKFCILLGSDAYQWTIGMINCDLLMGAANTSNITDSLTINYSDVASSEGIDSLTLITKRSLNLIPKAETISIFSSSPTSLNINTGEIKTMYMMLTDEYSPDNSTMYGTMWIYKPADTSAYVIVFKEMTSLGYYERLWYTDGRLSDWRTIPTIPVNGTSSQFVKGDGSLDSTEYASKSELDSISEAVISTISAKGTAPLSLSASKSGNTVNITGSISVGTGASQVAAGNHTHSNYAPIASPTFTGTPKAPTASTEESSNNDTQIANVEFVKALLNKSLADLKGSLVYKGTIGTSGTVKSLPANHTVGWTYVVNTAGSYAGETCEVGDMIICVTTGTSANNDHWTVVQTNINGAVTGPSSSINGQVAVFNGSTGKVIKAVNANTLSVGSATNATNWTGKPSWIGSSKPTYTQSEVGLGNVDNTSDADKPISTATQKALDKKLDKVDTIISNGKVTKYTNIGGIYTGSHTGYVVIKVPITAPTPFFDLTLNLFTSQKAENIKLYISGYSSTSTGTFTTLATNQIGGHYNLPVQCGWGSDNNLRVILGTETYVWSNHIITADLTLGVNNQSQITESIEVSITKETDISSYTQLRESNYKLVDLQTFDKRNIFSEDPDSFNMSPGQTRCFTTALDSTTNPTGSGTLYGTIWITRMTKVSMYHVVFKDHLTNTIYTRLWEGSNRNGEPKLRPWKKITPIEVSGTADQFIKGDGSLDSTEYRPVLIDKSKTTNVISRRDFLYTNADTRTGTKTGTLVIEIPLAGSRLYDFEVIIGSYRYYYKPTTLHFNLYRDKSANPNSYCVCTKVGSLGYDDIRIAEKTDGQNFCILIGNVDSTWNHILVRIPELIENVNYLDTAGINIEATAYVTTDESVFSKISKVNTNSYFDPSSSLSIGANLWGNKLKTGNEDFSNKSLFIKGSTGGTWAKGLTINRTGDTTTGGAFLGAYGPNTGVPSHLCLGWSYNQASMIIDLSSKKVAIGAGTLSPGGAVFSEALTVDGKVQADGFKTESGTSTQFLKADGSIDSTSYAKAVHTHKTSDITLLSGFSDTTGVISSDISDNDSLNQALKKLDITTQRNAVNNLVGCSEKCTVKSGSSQYASIQLKFNRPIVAGKYYTVTIESIDEVVDEGYDPAPGFECLLYDKDASTTLSKYGKFTKDNLSITLIATKSSETTPCLLLYAGVAGSSTAGRTTTFNKVIVTEGTTPAHQWYPSYDDMTRKVTDRNLLRIFDLEQGSINTTAGVNIVANHQVRTKNFIPINSSKLYAQVFYGRYYTPVIFYYNIDKTFISSKIILNGSWSEVITVPENTKYIKLFIRRTNEEYVPDEEGNPTEELVPLTPEYVIMDKYNRISISEEGYQNSWFMSDLDLYETIENKVNNDIQPLSSADIISAVAAGLK